MIKCSADINCEEPVCFYYIWKNGGYLRYRTCERHRSILGRKPSPYSMELTEDEYKVHQVMGL